MADERLRADARKLLTTPDPEAEARLKRDRCKAGQHCGCLKNLLTPEEQANLKLIVKGLRDTAAGAYGRLVADFHGGSPSDLASRLEELL